MKRFIFVFTIVMTALSADAFTIRNHATIAYIAQNHLTPEAQAAVQEILHGETMMEYASWPDFYRKTILDKDGRELQHTLFVDRDFRAIDSNEHDNAYNVIKEAVSRLKNYQTLPDAARIANLSILIHFVGDIHCPSHISYADNRHKKIKYYNYQLKGKGEPKREKFHNFWDSWAVDQVYCGGYVDLALILDTYSASGISRMQEGTLEDWCFDSAYSCKDIFDVEDEAYIDRPYVVGKVQLAKSQIRKAGYRLAALLNEIFK